MTTAPTRAASRLPTAGVLLAALLIGLTGCGSAPGTADPAAPADSAGSGDAEDGATGTRPGKLAGPCSFVTLAEVEQAYGKSGLEVEGTDQGCSFESPDGSGDVFTFSFDVYRDQASVSFDTFREINDDAEDLPGVGDEAIYRTEADILHVRVGDDYFLLTGPYPEPGQEEKTHQTTVQLAEAVAANL